MLSMAWLCAASPSAAQNSGAPWFQDKPVVYRNPLDKAPLVAIVECKSDRDAVASVEIDDGRRSWVQSSAQPAAREHRLAIFGLPPNTVVRIRVGLKVADGVASGETNQSTDKWSDWLDYQTPALPSGFPPVEIVEAKTERMAPGILLFATNLWIDDKSMLDYGYIVALNEQGQVIWFCRTDERIADLRLLANGNLLYQHGNYRIVREMDWTGRIVRSWYASNLSPSLSEVDAIPVAVDTMHHDVVQLSNSNFLTLSTELVEFDEFPSSELNATAPWKPARVVCDAIVEFQPNDGKIVNRLLLREVLDAKRFGYMSLSNFWKDKYDNDSLPRSCDWSHANGLVFDEQQQTVVVSLRHLDCLLKLDWPSGDLRWILGVPTGWGMRWQHLLLQPKGDLHWFYHQHSPKLTQRGVMLYDNGNYRARPYEPLVPGDQNASRVVEYVIDEEAMTVQQSGVLDRFGERRIYCPFYGEAERIGETILITHGGHIESSDGAPVDDVPGQRQWGEIMELDAKTREVVFHAKVDSGMASKYGWSIYRSLKIAPPWMD